MNNNDINNVSKAVNTRMDGAKVSFQLAQCLCVESLRSRIEAVQVLSEPPSWRSTFAVDGHVVERPTFEVAKKGVIASLEREIDFVCQLTVKQFEMAKARDFK